MSDQSIIDHAVERHQAGEIISDLEARVIANAWHGGQFTALYSFASTGTISPVSDDYLGSEVEDEIERELEVCAPLDLSHHELEALLAYVRSKGPRSAPEGWTNLHW